MDALGLAILVTLLLPGVGALLLTLPIVRSARDIRVASLLVSLVTFAASIWMALNFNWAQTGVVQPAHAAVAWVSGFGLSFGYGVDSISLWLVLLTTFLMPLTILGSFTALHGRLEERTREFHFWLLVLQSAMIGTFVATDIILFYVCFEFTLLPMFFLIGVFGSERRLQAAGVFFLYTFTGSMLTLAGLLYVAWVSAQSTGAWSFDIATLYAAAQQMKFSQQAWVLAALLAGFAVKVPLFPVHTWLPLAHTEAPTAGSVVLAGVLLKLGTYALLRFAVPMTPQAAAVFAPYIGALAVAGILVTALICWVQQDVKKLIAYSSVSHLGFCVLGLFALGAVGDRGNGTGQVGAVMYMINHGLSTGALFLCVGMIYERFHTRRMDDFGGLGRVMPVWGFFMVYFCLASLGLPGLNGFVGEFLTLLGAFSAEATLGWEFAALAGVGMIFGAIYILYMVGRVVLGPLKVPHVDPAWQPAGDPHGVRDLSLREVTVLTPLAVACLVIGLYPRPMLRSLEAPVAQLIQPAAVELARSSPQPLSPRERAAASATPGEGEPLVTQPTHNDSPLTPTLSRRERGPDMHSEVTR